MNKNLIAGILYNCICVICWTVIAIVFNKWWLALFAMFFTNSISYERTTK